MSESALSKIREAVASKVTETYTQTVFDQIATVGDGMQEAANGSEELKTDSKLLLMEIRRSSKILRNLLTAH